MKLGLRGKKYLLDFLFLVAIMLIISSVFAILNLSNSEKESTVDKALDENSTESIPSVSINQTLDKTLPNQSDTNPVRSVKGESTSEKSNTEDNLIRVTKIIDGDTIEIEGGEKVRYIGIDTPERNSCFYIQATEKNRELVAGKLVSLEKDVSETDRYGRLLRYVYVDDIFVNEKLVTDGFAHSASFPPDIAFQELFRTSENQARQNNKGLWSACGIKSSQTTNKTTSSNTQSPYPGSCKYSCTGTDRDCSDFSSQYEAQAFFNCCGFSAENDPMKLDSVGVGDGIACESI